jgi:hypothetical protein
MSNNDSQRSIDNTNNTVNTHQRRQRRKFHGLSCACVFCVDFYENKTRQTSPDWQCFCSECTDITSEEMEKALADTDFFRFLRRANNCLCRCGVCATCVSCTEFFYTVYWHKQTRIECKCPFCELYDCKQSIDI